MPKEFEQIKDLRPELQSVLLAKKGISDNGIFDVDIGDERVRYRYDRRFGLNELKKEKIKFGGEQIILYTNYS